MRRISIDEVQEHCSEASCWTVVEGNVYDITTYLPSHPGGNLILNMAGTDGTVLFHNHHLAIDRVMLVLNKFQIGVTDHKSMQIGDFYKDLRKRVHSFAKSNLNPHPWQPQALFIFEFMLHLFLLGAVCIRGSYCACVMLTSMIACIRLHAWGHALGHNMIFSPRLNEIFSNLSYVLCAFEINQGGYLHPGDENQRFAHKGHETTSSVFSNKRGPSEHVGNHHIFGALAEHDECHKMASVYGILRLESRIPWSPAYVGQHMLCSTSRGRFCLGMLQWINIVRQSKAKIQLLWRSKHVFLRPHLTLVLTHLMWHAFVVAVLFVRHGAVEVLCLSAISAFTCATLNVWLPIHTFWAEHVWDTDPSFTDLATDWGKVTLETTSSLQPLHSEYLSMNSLLFGPGTFDYHIEHTLFPSLNYWNYAAISPIVEQVASEHGLAYHKFVGLNQMHREISRTLLQLSLPDHKTITKSHEELNISPCISLWKRVLGL